MLVICLMLSGLCSLTIKAEDVVLQLKWKHQFQFAGYYAALEKGFYAEEGFNVTIKERSNDTSPVEDVLSGRATFGISDSSIVLQRMQNKPLVVLSAIYQHSPLVLLALADEDIRSPEDLIGKRVSYQKTIDGAAITAMFKVLGIETERYTYIPFNFNDTVLLTGEVDAFSAYITDQPQFYKAQGVDVTIIDPRNYGIDFYGDMIFSSQQYVENSPERAQDFVNASIKGWNYALAHTDEIIDLILTQYNTRKTKQLLEYEAKKTKPLISPDVIPIGTTFKERFLRIANTYFELGLVNKTSNLKGLILSEYVLKPFDVRYLVYGITVILLLLSIMAVFNRRLRKSVKLKTEELIQLNQNLQSNLDIIEEKNTQLEKANKSKSLFVANMSHEIRTPLNGVYGSLQLLDKEQLTAEAKSLIRTAMISSMNLRSIIDDILDFSKIEAGKLEVGAYNFDLIELISTTHEQLSQSALDKNLSFTYELEPPIYQYWIGDPSRIKQVLINVLSNALKFTDRGQITLKCKTNQKGIEFIIADTGIGMNEEGLSHLFEQFAQADSSITRKYGGTGLGMSICQTLVHLMGGKIDVESQLGIGSTFVINLPLTLSECPIEKTEAVVSIPDLTGHSILVAEDNRINQLIVTKLLKPTHVDINIVQNGLEAVEFIENEGAELIFMDIQMPVMDGKVACEKIRDKGYDMPIIALTANVMANDVQEYLVCGFNVHLAKPIEKADLYQLLSDYFNK